MMGSLARASVDGAVFAGLVWLLTRLAPRLSPAAKTFLWWLVSVKFLVALIWTAPIPLPVLPAVQAMPAPTVAAGTSAHGVVTAADSPRTTRSPGWPAVLTALWVAGAAVSLVAGSRRWLGLRRTIARSSRAPATIHDMTRDVAARLRVSRVPDVRLSDAIDTPLVAGVMRPAIVVPAGRFERLGAERQHMTLCHELAHIKRRDLWFGSAVALAERLFFFHPLAHLAAREYVFWREAACDAAVIDALGATPHEYGRLLLDLGVSAPRRTLAPAGAPWSFGNLKRRIVMLGRPSSPSIASRLAAAAALTIATAALVPLTLTARSAPMQTATKPAAERQAETGPKPPQDDRTPFVAFRAGGAATMSGSSDDMARAQQLHRTAEPMMWFRRNGTEYIVRDQWLMQEVREIWRRVSEASSRQAGLAAQQADTGARQNSVSSRQHELEALQGLLAAQQAALADRQAELAARASSIQDAAAAAMLRDRAALELKLRELERQSRALEPRLRELQQPMEELTWRMTALSADMEAMSLGVSAATADAEAKMRELLDRAIAGGLAQIVR